MIRSNRKRLLAVAAVGALALAACGSDDGDATDTTEAAADDTAAEETTETTEAATEETTAEEPETTEATETTEAEEEAAAEGWTVSTDDCVDPDAAVEPIEGTINIGSVMPLSNSPAAIAFAPVAEGLRAYFQYANEQGLLEGYELALTIEDDQYNKDLTPGAVEKLLDGGAHLITGIIGTPNNQAVRDLLNEECVPQLLNLTGAPAWGEVADYPWTTGGLIPYGTETKAYLKDIATNFPDGATVALYTVNSEFGQVYVDTVEEMAGEAGIEVVDAQTVEATDSAPPTAQLNSIASKTPDVIIAVPLGAQCPTFLNEVANAKAANPGWEPRVYLTNTCASALILGGAGENATGLITSSSSGLIDIGDADVVASDPEAQEYVAYMESIGKADLMITAGAGWNIGELTVAILQQAAASDDGITRASIMNAARNFTYEPTLGRPGVTYKMNGEDDPFLAEAVQLLQYDAATATFSDVGELVTEFES